jgi:hypothetical protein
MRPLESLIPPIVVFIFLSVAIGCSSSQFIVEESQVSRIKLEQDIEALAADSLYGRLTGTEEEKKAAHYIASRMNELGLKPKGTSGYYQDFSVVNPDNPHELTFDKDPGEQMVIRNVIGYVDNNSRTTVVIGAHYDHLGWGESGSLHVGSPSIHNGADDNASGVAAMLWLAEKLSASYTDNNYLFIAFSGEEQGLWGSNFFVKHPTIDLSGINYMINMDMIGRLNGEGTLVIHGTGTSPSWDTVIDEIDIKALNLVKKEGGIGPSDHTSFYLAQIPVLHFFTGQHEDYHKPSDDEHKINYDGMNLIVNFILGIISRLNDQDKIAFTETKDDNVRANISFNVTLGIVPDYLYPGPGIRIDGVREDRPASKGGLLKGDIITGMAQNVVDDMNTYMKLLSTFEPGQTIQVRIVRGEEKLIKTITFD